MQKPKRPKSVLATLFLVAILGILLGLAVNSSTQAGNRQNGRAGVKPEAYIAASSPIFTPSTKPYPTSPQAQIGNSQNFAITSSAPTESGTTARIEAAKPDSLPNYSDQALKQILSSGLQRSSANQLPSISNNSIASNLLPLDYSYNPIAAPTITFKIFEQVLAQGGSPALPEAAAMYAVCQRQYCDPALALAFFDQESSLGKQGVAVQTKSIGNIRCTPPGPCYETENNGSFRSYASWTAGLEAWAILLRETYLAKWKLATPEQIIPRYAPGEQSIEYIKGVKAKVNNLRLLGRLR